MSADELKKQYVWQCRRGMKEVEFLLNKYLEELYDTDSPEQHERFGRLLECQDADLFEWFTERSRPEDGELDAFIRDMRRRLAR